MEINELRDKLKNASPDILAKIKELSKMQDKLSSLYDKEYTKDVIINGCPARLTVYKRGKIEVDFRSVNECNEAIEKLLK